MTASTSVTIVALNYGYRSILERNELKSINWSAGAVSLIFTFLSLPLPHPNPLSLCHRLTILKNWRKKVHEHLDIRSWNVKSLMEPSYHKSVDNNIQNISLATSINSSVRCLLLDLISMFLFACWCSKVYLEKVFYSKFYLSPAIADFMMNLFKIHRLWVQLKLNTV